MKRNYYREDITKPALQNLYSFEIFVRFLSVLAHEDFILTSKVTKRHFDFEK